MTYAFLYLQHNLSLILRAVGIPLPDGHVPAGTVPAPPVGGGLVDVGAVGGEIAAQPPPGGFPGWIWAVYAGIFVLMYFIFFRPQRKREKKMREMRSAIVVGDNVVTSGGLFGKVADVGEDCFIVDFGNNRSIRIPVLKTDIVGIREPNMTPPPKVEG